MSTNHSPRLSPHVEDALCRCGRERVMHRSGPTPAVAITIENMFVSDAFGDTKVIFHEGGSYDEAGIAAASEFADRLRKHAAEVLDKSRGIEQAVRAHQKDHPHA